MATHGTNGDDTLYGGGRRRQPAGRSSFAGGPNTPMPQIGYYGLPSNKSHH